MTQVGSDAQKLVHISFRVPDPTRELQRKEAPMEKDLFLPIKTYFEQFGYICDGEVNDIDLYMEKEDFMLKLFGISGRTQESIDYWGE